MKTVNPILLYFLLIPFIGQIDFLKNENKTFKNINYSFSPQLGEYLSIKDHPKAKGVNMKIKVPIGWEVKDGDRPNIVKKFVKGDNVYLIQIRDNITFFTRNKSREAIQKDNFISDLVQKESSFFKNLEIIEQSIVTIDTYPAIQYKVKGEFEQMGYNANLILKSWIIFYEDKYIILQSMSTNDLSFYENEELYSLLTNSIIFPEHYN